MPLAYPANGISLCDSSRGGRIWRLHRKFRWLGERCSSRRSTGCLTDAIGDGGLSQPEVSAAFERSKPALAKLKQLRADGGLAATLGRRRSGSRRIDRKRVSRAGRGRADLSFLRHRRLRARRPDTRPVRRLVDSRCRHTGRPTGPRRPMTRFYDNLDPFTLEMALARMDLSVTRFVVTSKSGGTPETLSQALAALQAVKAAGLEARIPELFLGITEPRKAGDKKWLARPARAFRCPMSGT